MQAKSLHYFHEGTKEQMEVVFTYANALIDHHLPLVASYDMHLAGLCSGTIEGDGRATLESGHVCLAPRIRMC